ncbi:hypothetical protein [Streptomyces sp. NPDC092952]|uniref:hypothetical protein n=1 Tax=Streptomyces sp. NPDC092952 TaxID=3366018 RepID=UPI003829A50F
MGPEHPLVREVFPEFAGELVALLEAEGESDLAICAWDLRLVAECGCDDDACQSFRTEPHPDGQPYGPGHRCVPLLPEKGMLTLDVVDGRIMYVEVLGGEPLRSTAEGAEGRFVLHRFNGDEVYGLDEAVVRVIRSYDGDGEGGGGHEVTVWFEASAASDGARRCADTAEAGMVPSAEVGVGMTAAEAEIDRLVGRTFLMPGVPEGEDSALSLLYYFEHEPLRDNRITVVARVGDRLRLRWTGECCDVNFYDGSKPPARIEIEGDFRYRGPGD